MTTSTDPAHAASREQDSPLLPSEPPARIACVGAWLVLGVFAAALAFASLVKLPEVVVAPFVLEPMEGADPIQAPLAGELAIISVREGQDIKAGDNLFALRSDEIRNWQTRLRQLQEDQRAITERARNLDEAHTAELSIKDAEIAQIEREVNFRQKYLETSKDFLTKAGALAAQGLISQVELMRHQLETAEAEKDLVVAEKSQLQASLQRQQLVTARARQRTDEAAETEKLKVQFAALEGQLVNCTGDLKFVRAPYNAVVLSLKQHSAGSMVGTGMELCQLAHQDASPFARLTLPETGLSRLHLGQRLYLRFDAYPYQRFGSMVATLEKISPAAIISANGPTFQATCRLRPVQGNSLVNPKVGMSGQARILVGRCTLLEKVLEPLRIFREKVTAG
jgi:membrane fusion protein